MYTCMCDWLTLPCSRKLTEHCKSAIMEKKNRYVKKKEKIKQKIIQEKERIINKNKKRN